MTDTPHYVTPEEAEKMGCCMSMNRPEFAAACIGKTCMAWQWGKELVEYENGPFLQDIWRKSTTHGFCGMIRS